jgi:hypothetical protein
MAVLYDDSDPTEASLEVRAKDGQSGPILKVTDGLGVTLGYFDHHGQVYTYPSWEDLRFPASGFNPAGSTAPPTADTATGLLTFSGTADNIIGGVAQMPHAWKKGSAIKPHVHLIAPTGNAGKNSRWKFEYNRANNREAFENAYGSYTALPTSTVANPNSGTTLLFPDGFGSIDMTGYKESCCILWRITRLAASDVLDDDTTDWVLAEFDIHYQVEKSGTYTEIPV